MVNNKILMDDEAVFQQLFIILKSFLSKWSLFCNSISVDISNAERVYRNQQCVVTLRGLMIESNSIFKLIVGSIRKKDDSIYYYLTLESNVDCLVLFDNDMFSPREMNNSFWRMADNLFNIKIPEYDDDTGVAIVIDFNSTTFNIDEIVVSLYDINIMSHKNKINHNLYMSFEMEWLTNLNIFNPENLYNLRNFYFIWTETNIHEIFGYPSGFEGVLEGFHKSYLLYIEDMDRYNNLVKMEFI